MINFNELRITPDAKFLIIDVQVDPLDYYKDVYLDTIVVYTQQQYSSLGPSGTPIFTKPCEGMKHYRTVIDIDSISNNIFFVEVLTTGDASEDAPCGMSTTPKLGITYNKYPIYQQGMKMLRNMDNCEPNGDVINYILQQKAFDLSLKTGDYDKAKQYWDIFFNDKERVIKSNCGCHGRFR